MRRVYNINITLRELVALAVFLGTSGYFCWYMHRTEVRLFNFAHQVQEMLSVPR